MRMTENPIRCIRSALLAAAAIGMLTTSVAQAQTPAGDAGRGHVTRAELQQMLTNFEQMSASSGYSGSVREQARREAQLIRQRLTDGDIREGDRVLLVVEGQAALTDTFNVVAGRRIILPELDAVSLAGVLRSELQDHMHRFISRFVRNPTVHATSLMRVEIRGQVAQPGFYTVPSDIVLSDALMLAGGPTNDADLKKMRIARVDDVLWEGTRLREAVVTGQTLDQLSVRTGDLIELPQRRSFQSMLEILGVVSALTTVIMLVRGQAGS